MAAANQAGEHAGRAGTGDVEEITLEQLHDHVTHLARAYLTGPMLMFTSTPAKRAYLAAMTHIHLGHAEDAIGEASAAIELWTSGPPEECAGSVLAVTRIDLITAHLLRGELDAAEQAAGPLLAVGPEQRTTIVLTRLDGLQRHRSALD